jgi:hypothetical protein
MRRGRNHGGVVCTVETMFVVSAMVETRVVMCVMVETVFVVSVMVETKVVIRSDGCHG